jgi:molecular chaperone GrpE
LPETELIDPMTDDTRKNEKIEINKGDPAAEDKSAWQTPPEGMDALADADAYLLGAFEAEKAELKNQLLRTLADMENLRRRTQKQVRDASQFAIANFARDLLSVGDNLRRAIETVSDDARAAADGDLKTLLEGVELTERDMLRALEKHGVTKSDPQGDRFDPNFHQAMFEVPNPDVASGTVVQVMQPGYIIGDRVLRPAMVGVAKGGPKSMSSDGPPETEATEATEATEEDNGSDLKSGA